MNRQITLCRLNGFTGGGYLTGAEFSNAYIYKTNGTYAQTLASNCASGRTGAFGTNNTTKNLVKVDSSFTKQWYAEKVSINF